MQFIDILKAHNIPIGTHGPHVRVGWVNVDCPFCAPGSRKFHLGYNKQSSAISCWRCGRHGLSTTVAALTGLTPQAARALVAGLERVIYVPRHEQSGTFKPPGAVGDLADCHRSYLQSRGFTPEALERDWGIGGIGLAAKLKFRIYIPIHLNGEPVSWTTRSIAPQATYRYISAKPEEEAISHKTLLYGEDKCGQACIVHEGPIDVWATGPGAVATMGILYSRAQIARLARFMKRCICFDAEPIAQRRAKELMELLAPYPGETFNVVLETGKDSASAAELERQALRKLVFG